MRTNITKMLRSTATKKMINHLHLEVILEAAHVKDVTVGVVLVTSLTATLVGSVILIGKLFYQ